MVKRVLILIGVALGVGLVIGNVSGYALKTHITAKDKQKTEEQTLERSSTKTLVYGAYDDRTFTQEISLDWGAGDLDFTPLDCKMPEEQLLQLIKAEKKSIAEVLVVPMVQDLTVPIQIATDLRKKGISTEVYLNDKKLKAKIKYADKLEIPYVIVVGEDEINSGIVKIKNMKTGEEKETSIQNIEL